MQGESVCACVRSGESICEIGRREYTNGRVRVSGCKCECDNAMKVRVRE